MLEVRDSTVPQSIFRTEDRLLAYTQKKELVCPEFQEGERLAEVFRSFKDMLPTHSYLKIFGTRVYWILGDSFLERFFNENKIPLDLLTDEMRRRFSACIDTDILVVVESPLDAMKPFAHKTGDIDSSYVTKDGIDIRFVKKDHPLGVFISEGAYIDTKGLHLSPQMIIERLTGRLTPIEGTKNGTRTLIQLARGGVTNGEPFVEGPFDVRKVSKAHSIPEGILILIKMLYDRAWRDQDVLKGYINLEPARVVAGGATFDEGVRALQKWAWNKLHLQDGTVYVGGGRLQVKVGGSYLLIPKIHGIFHALESFDEFPSGEEAPLFNEFVQLENRLLGSPPNLDKLPQKMREARFLKNPTQARWRASRKVRASKKCAFAYYKKNRTLEVLSEVHQFLDAKEATRELAWYCSQKHPQLEAIGQLLIRNIRTIPKNLRKVIFANMQPSWPRIIYECGFGVPQFSECDQTHEPPQQLKATFVQMAIENGSPEALKRIMEEVEDSCAVRKKYWMAVSILDWDAQKLMATHPHPQQLLRLLPTLPGFCCSELKDFLTTNQAFLLQELGTPMAFQLSRLGIKLLPSATLNKFCREEADLEVAFTHARVTEVDDETKQALLDRFIATPFVNGYTLAASFASSVGTAEQKSFIYRKAPKNIRKTFFTDCVLRAHPDDFETLTEDFRTMKTTASVDALLRAAAVKGSFELIESILLKHTAPEDFSSCLVTFVPDYAGRIHYLIQNQYIQATNSLKYALFPTLPDARCMDYLPEDATPEMVISAMIRVVHAKAWAFLSHIERLNWIEGVTNETLGTVGAAILEGYLQTSLTTHYEALCTIALDSISIEFLATVFRKIESPTFHDLPRLRHLLLAKADENPAQVEIIARKTPLIDERAIVEAIMYGYMKIDPKRAAAAGVGHQVQATVHGDMIEAFVRSGLYKEAEKYVRKLPRGEIWVGIAAMRLRRNQGNIECHAHLFVNFSLLCDLHIFQREVRPAINYFLDQTELRPAYFLLEKFECQDYLLWAKYLLISHKSSSKELHQGTVEIMRDFERRPNFLLATDERRVCWQHFLMSTGPIPLELLRGFNLTSINPTELDWCNYFRHLNEYADEITDMELIEFCGEIDQKLFVKLLKNRLLSRLICALDKKAQLQNRKKSWLTLFDRAYEIDNNVVCHFVDNLLQKLFPLCTSTSYLWELVCKHISTHPARHRPKKLPCKTRAVNALPQNQSRYYTISAAQTMLSTQNNFVVGCRRFSEIVSAYTRYTSEEMAKQGEDPNEVPVLGPSDIVLSAHSKQLLEQATAEKKPMAILPQLQATRTLGWPMVNYVPTLKFITAHPVPELLDEGIKTLRRMCKFPHHGVNMSEEDKMVINNFILLLITTPDYRMPAKDLLKTKNFEEILPRRKRIQLRESIVKGAQTLDEQIILFLELLHKFNLQLGDDGYIDFQVAHENFCNTLNANLKTTPSKLLLGRVRFAIDKLIERDTVSLALYSLIVNYVAAALVILPQSRKDVMRLFGYTTLKNTDGITPTLKQELSFLLGRTNEVPESVARRGLNHILRYNTSEAVSFASNLVKDTPFQKIYDELTS